MPLLCSSSRAYSEISGISNTSDFKDTETLGLDTISPVLALGSNCFKFSFPATIIQDNDMENVIQSCYETCFKRDIDTIVLTMINFGMMCY